MQKCLRFHVRLLVACCIVFISANSLMAQSGPSDGRPSSLLEQLERMSHKSHMQEQKNLELQLQNLYRKQERNIFIWLCALLVVLVGAVLIIHIQSRRRKKALSIQNMELKKLLQLWEELIFFVSHDLRIPLANMQNGLELLENNGMQLNDDDRQMMVSELKDSNFASLQTLENMLAWTSRQYRQTGILLEHIEIQPVIDRVCQLYASVARQKFISLHHNTTVPTMAIGDEQKLECILRNLVSNAIKFSHMGSDVYITAEQVGEHTVISVTDKGTGMSPDAVKVLFDLQRRITVAGSGGEKGAGLGLLIAHQYLRDMNGIIHIESRLGQGTTFYVSLPRDAMVGGGTRPLQEVQLQDVG